MGKNAQRRRLEKTKTAGRPGTVNPAGNRHTRRHPTPVKD